MDGRPGVHVLNPHRFPELSTTDRPALLAGSDEISFGGLEASISALATALEDLPPGIVVVEARPKIARVVLLLASLRAGRPTAVLSTEWAGAEKKAHRRLLGRWLEVDDTGELVRAATIDSAGPSREPHPDTALILLTSGSTGGPRAVQLSRRSIEATTATLVDLLDFPKAEEQALFLPLSYSFGLLGQLLPALRAGVPTRLLAGVGEARIELESGRARGMWSGVPAHWRALLDLISAGTTARVSHVVSAGDHMAPDLRKRIREAFPNATIYNNYGQTEAGPRILSLSSEHPDFFRRGDGLPVGDFELRLEPDGELCAKGTPLMLGYLGNDEASGRKVIDGWLHTGDLATIDDDGLVTILGRTDNLVNIAGERVSLQEIETALQRLDKVADAAVVVEDDETYGRALVGLIVAEERFELGRRDITENLSLELSWNKIPRRYYLVDSLKRGKQGKLVRGELPSPGDKANEID